jgi:hypothetical protein
MVDLNAVFAGGGRRAVLCLLLFASGLALSQGGQGDATSSGKQSPPAASQPSHDTPSRATSEFKCSKSDPAQVSYQEGKLSIVAECSVLKGVLGEILSKTSIPFDGEVQDERISGKFGPGVARDVIEQLLQKAGYNYILVGDGSRYSLTSVVIAGKAKAEDEAAKTQPLNPSSSSPQSSSNSGTSAAPAAADIAIQNQQPATALTPSSDGSPYIGGNPDSATVQQSHDQLRSLKQQQSAQQSNDSSRPH